MPRRLPLPLLTVALTLIALLATSSAARAAQLVLVGSALGSPSVSPYQQWVDDSYAPTYPGVVEFALSPGQFSCGGVDLRGVERRILYRLRVIGGGQTCAAAEDEQI